MCANSLPQPSAKASRLEWTFKNDPRWQLILCERDINCARVNCWRIYMYIPSQTIVSLDYITQFRNIKLYASKGQFCWFMQVVQVSPRLSKYFPNAIWTHTSFPNHWIFFICRGWCISDTRFIISTWNIVNHLFSLENFFSTERK